MFMKVVWVFERDTKGSGLMTTTRMGGQNQINIC